MRKYRGLVGVMGLLVMSLVLSGCLNLFAPKVGQVKGTVTYESGTPIANAEVKLGTAVAKTNGQGSYAFLNMKHGTYDFAVVVDGATVHTQKVTVSSTPVTVNVKVPDPVQYGTIAGTVKLEDDTPVADAAVKLGERSTTTDAAGAFEFKDVPYGAYTVTAEVDGKEYSAAANLNAPQITVDIVVPLVISQGDVTGVVKDAADRPVAGAKVSLGSEHATTDAAGAFQFTGVAVGTYTLTISVWDQDVYNDNVEVNAATVDLAIPVEVARVTGTVVDQDDNPVEGAIVDLQPLDVSTTTAADGSYAFMNIPYYAYDFYVEVDGDRLHVHELDVAQPDVVYSPQVTLPSAGPVLVYEEDFSGVGTDPTDFGWTALVGWSIVERDGKRWIQSDHAPETRASIEIPEFANANLVIVEYTTILDAGAAAALRLLADDPSHNRGGTNFAFSLLASQLTMRRHTNNDYPGITPNTGHHVYTASIPTQAGDTVRIRVEYDHVNKTLDAYVNDAQVSGYPWDVPDTGLIQSPTNTYLMLHSNINSTGLWTDLKVWVE